MLVWVCGIGIVMLYGYGNAHMTIALDVQQFLYQEKKQEGRA